VNKSIASTQGQKNKRYSVKKPSIAHFFVSQSRLTDAVSVIFGELLSYEHPPKEAVFFIGLLGYLSAYIGQAQREVLIHATIVLGQS